jgi:glycosyltransferase involved in cell wall biosynthesis
MIYVIGISPNKIGGIERFARELASQMSGLGWKLVLCFEALPSARVRKFLDTPNLSIEVLAKQSGTGPSKYLRLIRLLVRYRPSVLVYSFNGVLSFIPWVSSLLGVRTIFYNDQSSRQYQLALPRNRAWKRLLGRIMTFPLDGVICVSDYVSRCVYREQWVTPTKVDMVHSGVDPSQNRSAHAQAARFRQMNAIPVDRKIILKVSWLVPEKGIDTFLQAARLVIARDSRAHFVIVGAGSFLEKYRALSLELGIANNVTWTGGLEDPIGEGAYAAAQVACQLSTWQEAFGFTIIEAMSCGVPVIATRLGGIPEIIRDGVNGFLVPVNDPNSTSDSILTLLADSSLRDKMGQAARADVQANFDVRETAQKYLKRLGIQKPNLQNEFGTTRTASAIPIGKP